MTTFLFSTQTSIASSIRTTSLGELATDLIEPVSIVSDFIGTGSIIIGICSLIGAFLRYLEYRKNPMVSPISTIVVLFIIGLALVSLPFIYKLTGEGIPYHLF